MVFRKEVWLSCTIREPFMEGEEPVLVKGQVLAVLVETPFKQL